MNYTHRYQDSIEPAYIIEARRWHRICSLLDEVMQWHSDPESSDYNECDKSPCVWCEQAREAMDQDKPMKGKQ